MISQAEIDAARRVDPAPIWTQLGFSVTRSAAEIRVLDDTGSCLYRSTRKADGTWLSSAADAGVAIAEGVGDNISLFRHFLGQGFRDAVESVLALVGERVHENTLPAPAQREKKIQLPFMGPGAATSGRRYLMDRGISLSVLEKCENAGILSYSAKNMTLGYGNAVYFLGRDEKGRLAFAMRRRAGAAGRNDTIEKRNLMGSDDRYVPFFRGSATVYITEGGVNMLSIIEAHERLGFQLPTVIMTAGQGNLKWLETRERKKLLENASHVFVVDENDDHLSPEAQSRGRELKARMLDAVSAACGGKASLLFMPAGENDMNDVLMKMPEALASLFTQSPFPEEGMRP